MKIESTALEKQIADLRSGDPVRRDRVLRSLYEHPTVGPKVSEWLTRYGAGGTSADDIVQEAVLLLYEKVLDRNFTGRSQLTTFLLGICFNLIRNRGRKVDRIDQLPDYDTLELAEENDPERQILFGEATSAEQQRDRLLREVLAGMRENCRQALSLYYYQEKSTAQVAEEKGLKNANQAKKLLSRCRKKLKELISAQPTLNALLNG